MKTAARYYFDSKTEMNEWLNATKHMHYEQAIIEEDPDYQLYIYDESIEIEVFIGDAAGYFPEIDGEDWNENHKYQVVV